MTQTEYKYENKATSLQSYRIRRFHLRHINVLNRSRAMIFIPTLRDYRITLRTIILMTILFLLVD